MKTSIPFRTLLLSSLFVVGAATTPAQAQLSVNISLAPPASHYEAVPVIAPGYIWAPGYWAWSGERHVWVRGRPIMQRAGYRWEPDRWEQRGDHYYRHEGRWEYDKHDKPKKHKKEKKEKHGNKHDR